METKLHTSIGHQILQVDSDNTEHGDTSQPESTLPSPKPHHEASLSATGVVCKSTVPTTTTIATEVNEISSTKGKSVDPPRSESAAMYPENITTDATALVPHHTGSSNQESQAMVMQTNLNRHIARSDGRIADSPNQGTTTAYHIYGASSLNLASANGQNRIPYSQRPQSQDEAADQIQMLIEEYSRIFSADDGKWPSFSGFFKKMLGMKDSLTPEEHKRLAADIRVKDVIKFRLLKLEADYQQKEENLEAIYRDRTRELEKEHSKKKSKWQKDLENHNSQLRTQVGQLQMSNEGLRDQLLLSQRLKTQGEERHRAMEKRYEQRITELERNQEAQEGIIYRAQSAAKAIMDQNVTFASSDTDIISWFRNRATAWSTWAKDAAHRRAEWFEELGSEDRKDVQTEISKFVGNNGVLPSELWHKKKTVHILLNALLANFICRKVFSTPWWILEAIEPLIPPAPVDESSPDTSGDVNMSEEEDDQRHPKAPAPPIPLSSQLHELYHSLIQVNPRDAHQWRSQTVRMFAVNGFTEPNAGAGKTDSRWRDQRLRYAKKLTENFLSNVARFLLEPGEYENQAGSLEDEINACLQQSVRLWSQRSFIQCYGLGDLRNMDFGAKRRILQPYESQELKSDDDCYRMPVAVVLQPAILAWGTEEGHNYDTASRVWLKATVFV